MPTYGFRCPNGHEFDRFYKTISAGVSELPCPECGAIATRQLFGGGLVFKGSGFYLTDYGKNAHRGTGPKKTGDKTEKSETKSEPKPETKSETKSETKPETKSETKAESSTESSKASPKPKKE